CQVNTHHQPKATLFPYTTLFRSPLPKGGFLRLTHAFVGQPLQESMKMQLRGRLTRKRNSRRRIGLLHGCWPILPAMGRTKRTCVDRKSTRLNSSHVKISYAVFCM